MSIGSEDQQGERIGPLIFVSNADYPYPFDVAQPPRFWMEEQTGALAEAVEAHINGDTLTPQHLELIRIYLRQYLERAVLSGDADRKQLLAKVERLRSTRDLVRFADELPEWGLEPF